MALSEGRGKRGFTLIEMLVVIGIIAVLSGALVVGLGKVQKTAQRAKAQESVSNAATALITIFQTEMAWPSRLMSNSGKQLDASTSHVFVRFNQLGLSYDSKKYTASTKTGTIKLTGSDRCGVVDPWALAELKRHNQKNENEGKDLKVSTGKTVQDHILWYAVDKDADGITEADVGGVKVKVRAPAIVWSAGADGEVGAYGERSKEGQDDVYSWAKGQVVK